MSHRGPHEGISRQFRCLGRRVHCSDWFLTDPLPRCHSAECLRPIELNRSGGASATCTTFPRSADNYKIIPKWFQSAACENLVRRGGEEKEEGRGFPPQVDCTRSKMNQPMWGSSKSNEDKQLELGSDQESIIYHLNPSLSVAVDRWRQQRPSLDGWGANRSANW